MFILLKMSQYKSEEEVNVLYLAQNIRFTSLTDRANDFFIFSVEIMSCTSKKLVWTQLFYFYHTFFFFFITTRSSVWLITDIQPGAYWFVSGKTLKTYLWIEFLERIPSCSHQVRCLSTSSNPPSLPQLDTSWPSGPMSSQPSQWPLWRRRWSSVGPACLCLIAWVNEEMWKTAQRNWDI